MSAAVEGIIVSMQTVAGKLLRGDTDAGYSYPRNDVGRQHRGVEGAHEHRVKGREEEHHSGRDEAAEHVVGREEKQRSGRDEAGAGHHQIKAGGPARGGA